MSVLANQVALVTGASRGIGRAIAFALGHAGAAVIGTATSDAGANRISAHLAEAGIKGRGLVLTRIYLPGGKLSRLSQLA